MAGKIKPMSQIKQLLQFYKQDLELCCAIGIEDYNSEPYYGITYHGCMKKGKINIIESFIDKRFKCQGFEVSPRWYIYKYSNLDSIFEEYRNFLSETINQFTVQEQNM